MTSHDLDDYASAAPKETSGPASQTGSGGTADPAPAPSQPTDAANADAEGATPPDDEELAKLRAECDEHLDTLRRVSAEFANFRRRTGDKEVAAARRAEETLLRTVVLPVVDALEAARAHHTDVLDPVWRAALAELDRAGLERLDPLGKPFDPAEHEALVADGEGTSTGTVAAVLRAGYRWRGQLLRAAQVHVHYQPDPVPADDGAAPIPEQDDTTTPTT